MKLTPNIAVAVYSARQCSLLTTDDAFQLVKESVTDSVPDSDHLLAIQRDIQPTHYSPNISHLVIVIPDSWLSVSQHLMDHLVPPLLLPMAALSYAVETTFSPPETLLFTYQQTVLDDKQTHLKVLACSTEWADQLRAPFKGWAEAMYIMSMSQWLGMKSPRLHQVKSYCQRNTLQIYQPQNKKRHKSRQLWAALILLSVFVNGLAVAYWFELQHRSDQALSLRDTHRHALGVWQVDQENEGFSDNVLALLKTLPKSARLVWMNGDVSSMRFQITLLEHELDRLLTDWQQQYPEWQWKVNPLRSASSMFNQQGVIDVSVSVFQSQ